ncbi:Uncharacterised protein [Achromobacter xylosoxidans]|nr:Uncharacterised protein [Achromobacter xylosoxidans]
MSRDPMIWWNLMTAFLFMLALVLAANLFADAVRDAFDPRTRRYKPGRLPGMGWFGRRPGAALAADARATKSGDAP